jgi:CheY-like chemotaxis protein
LKKHFKHVESSTSSETAQAELEQHPPDVLVLAFTDLEQAQPYCKTFGGPEHAVSPQRSVLLCKEEDGGAAFEMCKRRYFDDYVLWPNPQDRLRLAMSVWLACRAAIVLREHVETGARLATHAEHVATLDRKVTHELEIGENQAAAAQASMIELEKKLASANDEFSHELELKSGEALAEGLAQFKAHQLDLARTARDQGVKPMSTWAQGLRAKVEPSLGAARSFAAKVRQERPTLLVVEDNETTRGLLTPALRTLGYDIVLVCDGERMFSELVRTRPNVILMDLVSKGSDAVGLTRQLKVLPDFAQIPIVILSGDSRKEMLIRSLQAGASDFIAKPFTSDVLRSKLDRVMRQGARA